MDPNAVCTINRLPFSARRVDSHRQRTSPFGLSGDGTGDGLRGGGLHGVSRFYGRKRIQRAESECRSAAASLWFSTTLQPQGWELPPVWDAIAGDYATVDGWIRLHTNAPAHRKVVEAVLGHHADRQMMAKTVKTWRKRELEQAIVVAGGCAAEMRSAQAWQEHIQGKSVAQEPLFQRSLFPSQSQPAWPVTRQRPLQGIRVLDLTRIIAGPVATRFLAGFGADVLRIDPFGWEEPSQEPDVTLGKRCARLNLHNPQDRHTFEQRLREADVIVHGYRAGALHKLGYTSEQRRLLSPGLVDVCLNAYGWSGPWRERRGF